MCLFDVFKEEGRKERGARKWMLFRMGGGWGVSGSDSQVTTPSDDPRLGLADAQLALAAVQTRPSDQNQTGTTRLVGAALVRRRTRSQLLTQHSHLIKLVKMVVFSALYSATY